MSNFKFIQVEREIVRAIKELGGPAAAVYLMLCDYCWGKFGEKWWSWPTVKTMMNETGFGRRTVFLALSVLEDRKWIKRAGPAHPVAQRSGSCCVDRPNGGGCTAMHPPKMRGCTGMHRNRCTDMHDGVHSAAPQIRLLSDNKKDFLY